LAFKSSQVRDTSASGFIGEAEAQHTWVTVKTKNWANAISELVMVADYYLQAP
jgi:hypothetical protein